MLDFLGPLQLGLGLADTIGQDINTLFANLGNEGRYQEGREAIDMFGRQFGAGPRRAEMGQVRQLYNQAADFNTSRWDQLRGLFGRRTTQGRRDINRAFDREIGASDMDLAQRGLSASTLATSGRRGINAERQAQINRWMDQRTAEQMGLEERAGGSNLEMMLGRADLIANQQTQLRQEERDRLGIRLNWLNNKQDVAPSEGNYLTRMANLGQSLAPAYQPPEASLAGPLIGATGGVVSAATLGSILAGGPGAGIGVGTILMGGVCVHIAAHVMTEEYGEIPIYQLEEGVDRILCPDGCYHKVLFVGICPAHRDLKDRYMAIVTEGRRGGAYRSLALTVDHYISGQPASSVKAGDHVNAMVRGAHDAAEQVVKTQMVNPFTAADLIVEGSDEYVANGYAVSSMLALNDKTVRHMQKLRREYFQEVMDAAIKR